jgi:hypothetical protein
LQQESTQSTSQAIPSTSEIPAGTVLKGHDLNRADQAVGEIAALLGAAKIMSVILSEAPRSGAQSKDLRLFLSMPAGHLPCRNQ